MNNSRRTITSKGRIEPKGYGASRWDNPRIRECGHPDCPNPATVLKPANICADRAHNCCTKHEEDS